MPVTTKRGCPSSEILANLDGAIAAASEQGAEEFLVALRWSSQELLETIRSRLRASPLPVRLLPDHVTIQVALTPFERAIKRVLDVVVSMTAIVFFSPIFFDCRGCRQT